MIGMYYFVAEVKYPGNEPQEVILNMLNRQELENAIPIIHKS